MTPIDPLQSLVETSSTTKSCRLRASKLALRVPFIVWRIERKTYPDPAAERGATLCDHFRSQTLPNDGNQSIGGQRLELLKVMELRMTNVRDRAADRCIGIAHFDLDPMPPWAITALCQDRERTALNLNELFVVHLSKGLRLPKAACHDRRRLADIGHHRTETWQPLRINR